MVEAYTLRPYQEEALEEVFDALKKQPTVLLQASTGAGKTILVCDLIKRFRTAYPSARVLFLAHRKDLVLQNYDKMLKVWPEGKEEVGIACSGADKIVSIDTPVVIGSPQTLVRRLDDVASFKLIIVDEAHRLPLKRKNGRKHGYVRVLEDLLEKAPETRIFGITATPFVLGHGHIYGRKCRNPALNWFKNLTYSIGIQTLQKLGYLSLFEVMEKASPDLSGIQLTGEGEYNEGELGRFMSQDVHIETAVKAFEAYASDRKHVVVFAVTIEHAELLAAAFRKAGYPTEAVHSDGIPDKERRGILGRFESGETRILVNVGILTEGWDSPHTDCLILCRPTQSPALHVQIIGRGLRICEGKNDCLVLDLVGNTAVHGDVWDPIVRWLPRRKLTCPVCKTDMWSDDLDSLHWFQCKGCKTALTVCRNRNCGAVNLASSTLCTKCEQELYPVSGGPFLCEHCNKEVSPRDIICKWCNGELKTIATDVELEPKYSPDFPARWMPVMSAPEACDYRTDAKNLVSFKVRVLDEEMNVLRDAFGTLDPEGYSEKARKFFYIVWKSMSVSSTHPKTVAEVLDRLGELRFPPQVQVARNQGRNEIKNWGQNGYPGQTVARVCDDGSRFPVTRGKG